MCTLTLLLHLNLITLLLLPHTQASRFLSESILGLTELVWSPEPSNIFLGSPSILRLPNGDLLASSDRFGSGFKTQRNVSVYRSTNNGTTWSTQPTWVTDQYWSNLFQVDSSSNQVYLLGTATDGPAPIQISKSMDGGATWNQTTTLFGSVKSNDSFETGPTPSLIVTANNKSTIYRAVERMRPPFHWPSDYEATCVYADATSDLLDKNNWKMAQPLPFNNSWIPHDWLPRLDDMGYLEGNMVEGPDHENIYNILRLNTRSCTVLGNKAVVLLFDQEHNRFEFDSIIDLPGGHSKFVIRRHPSTGMYVTLSNVNTIPTATDQRNRLSLCTSTTMKDWTERVVLLKDDTGFTVNDSIKYTGFHYVDWQFDGTDGTDIIMLVRTAYRGAVSYHNSNRLTYKRISNWQKLVQKAVEVDSREDL